MCTFEMVQNKIGYTNLIKLSLGSGLSFNESWWLTGSLIGPPLQEEGFVTTVIGQNKYFIETTDS